jgi:hypothetical protein
MEPMEIEDRIRAYAERLRLRERVDTHPYAVVAAAAGLGFILAGGLYTRLACRVAGFGLRQLALPIALERIVALSAANEPI